MGLPNERMCSRRGKFLQGALMLIGVALAGCASEEAVSPSRLLLEAQNPLLAWDDPPPGTVLDSVTTYVFVPYAKAEIDKNYNSNFYAPDRMRVAISSWLVGLAKGWVSARGDVDYTTPSGSHNDHPISCQFLMICSTGTFVDTKCSAGYSRITVNSVHRVRFRNLSSEESYLNDIFAECDSSTFDDPVMPPPASCDDPYTEIVETECGSGGSGTATGGSSSDQTIQVSNTSGGGPLRMVCEVIDWYQSTNGGPWVYLASEVVPGSCHWL